MEGLWAPATEVLSVALASLPSTSWPLLIASLTSTQIAFLEGDCNGRSHRAPPPSSPRLLSRRFRAEVGAGGAAAGGGSTDSAVRLTQLLKAMAGASNNAVERKAREWVPLFLAFSGTKVGGGEGATAPDEEDEEDDAEEDVEAKIGATISGAPPSTAPATAAAAPGGAEEGAAHIIVRVPQRTWRAALREWLGVLAGLKGVRGVYRATSLQVAVTCHVMDVDPALQQAALKCLKAFKPAWLLPYIDRLLRLADNRSLREELTAFPLAVRASSTREGDAMAGILPEHRAQVVPLLIQLLYPKMRKRSGRLGGKGESWISLYSIPPAAATVVEFTTWHI